MPDLTTFAVGITSLVLGWLLKTATDRWTWRRQLVLNAYIEFFDAVDRFSVLATRAFREGAEMTNRTAGWLNAAEDARQALAAVDRAHGKLRLMAGWLGAELSAELYGACEAMFRSAIAIPPSSYDQFQDASRFIINRFNEVVDQARRELHLRHWRERLPFGSRSVVTGFRFTMRGQPEPDPRAEPYKPDFWDPQRDVGPDSD